MSELAGPGSQVPTARAARGGGYRAIAESNLVGPEGGQVVADRTVNLINSLCLRIELGLFVSISSL
jgi:hypothetical protein